MTPLGRTAAHSAMRGIGVLALFFQLFLTLVWFFTGDDEPAARAGRPPLPTTVEITYIVTGAAGTGDVRYTTQGGTLGRDDAPLPFKATARIERGTSITLYAQNPGESKGRQITCTILADGAVVKQSSDSGDSATATCESTVGEDPPLPGLKAPDTTPRAQPGLAEGESRLTKVVKVKDYPGKGSPVVGRVTDDDARISYAEFGGDWGKSRAVDPHISGNDQEQRFDTEPKWQAAIVSGVVDSDLMDHYTGRDRHRALATAVMDEAQKYDYDSGAGRDVASQPITVGGRKGWVVVREIRFVKPGIRAKVDLGATVIVDTGRVRPAFITIEIPDTHKRLWPDINALIGSVRTTS
ncbi:hypothetical protein [Actinomadura macrotermitis]|uniref:Uncharacterized protein n=1 Tax=Actinomadura macrotermitis TaxID=2585200 RepID=A0A7K0BWL4_9ACTN|nr:hypothetical protein [Actinomadura macrotermitis]MQY05573.1 hypothetical protein [Actinomadura macrotermitis]